MRQTIDQLLDVPYCESSYILFFGIIAIRPYGSAQQAHTDILGITIDLWKLPVIFTAIWSRFYI